MQVGGWIGRGGHTGGRETSWKTMGGGIDLDGRILKGGGTTLAERLNVGLRGMRMTLKGLA